MPPAKYHPVKPLLKGQDSCWFFRITSFGGVCPLSGSLKKKHENVLFWGEKFRDIPSQQQLSPLK